MLCETFIRERKEDNKKKRGREMAWKYFQYLSEYHWNLQSDFLIHLSLVRWRLVEISALMESWLFLHTAPNNFNPSTAKLQSSKLGFSASSATQTSRWSSSRDHELACATHWRVAVINASGLNNPMIENLLMIWKCFFIFFQKMIFQMLNFYLYLPSTHWSIWVGWHQNC